MFRITILTVVVLVLAVGGLIAQDAENVEMVGRLYDFWDGARDIAVVNDLAYLTTGIAGLRIIDVSRPNEPTVIGRWEGLTATAYEITVRDNFVFMACRSEGFIILDASDPENPYVIGRSAMHSSRGIALRGEYAYLLHTSLGLCIIDINEPENPIEIGRARADDAYRITLSGDFAFVAAGPSILVFDVSDPRNPRRVSEYETQADALDIEVRGDYAYVAESERGLTILDISDPDNIREVGIDSTNGRTVSVALLGNHAYVTESNTSLLREIDISDPFNPFENNRFTSYNSASDVAIVGEYAYIADGLAGLTIAQIGDPPFSTIGVCGESGELRYLAEWDDYLYMIDYRHNIVRMIDAFHPNEPINMGEFDEVSVHRSIDVNDEILYIGGARGYRGLYSIVNIEEPLNPIFISDFEVNGSTRKMEIAGDYAFAGSMLGISVFNLSEPQNPDSVSFYDSASRLNDLIISGSYAYIAESDGLILPRICGQ